MGYTPKYTNLTTLLQSSVEQFSHKPLFGTRRPDGWHWTTYGEFGTLVDHARSAFVTLGVERGDRIAAIANNRLEWAVAAHAAYSMGAVFVPMYEAQLDKEWAYILTDSASKVCLAANRGIQERLESLRADIPSLESIVTFDGGEFDGLLEAAAAKPEAPAKIADEDIATYIYTSGTTGNPKGVMLTHFSMAANVSALLEISPLEGEERALSFLPWAHVFGGTVELNSIIAYGGSTAICDDTTKLLDYLPEVRPTNMFAVPRIWNRIYDGVQKLVATKPGIVQSIFANGMSARSKLKRGEPLTFGEKISLPLAEKLVFSKIVDRFGGRLKFAFSGAAALSRDVAEFIDNLGIQVYEGYGMTESCGGTTGNRPGACKLGSVGKPFPGVEVKIDENAEGAGPGEGEILIYGTGVMVGYHNLEDVTKETLTEDGGLRSGDLGRLDDEGFLYITGRVKELYKLENGKYVAPAPLEERVQLAPHIAQCIVYGSDHPHNVALVIPDMEGLRGWAKGQGIGGGDDAILTNAKTKAMIMGEVDAQSGEFKGFERIRDIILDGEELSPDNGMLTPTLKVKRRVVMEKYGQRLKALY